MKELTIEQKAERYDEALKWMENVYPTLSHEQQMEAEAFFPMFKESEDEKIRKELLNAFQESEDSLYMVLTPHRRESFIAWLEKQGENANFRNKIQIGDKVTRNEDGVLVNLSQLNRVAKKQGEQKPANKIEPKFHQGEWITNGDYTWKIIEVKPLDYILQSQDGNIVDDTISHVDEQFHSFTIQDAKDGDVLATKAGGIFIYKELLYDKPFAYCGVDKFGVFKDCNCGNGLDWTPYLSDVTPATNEHRDLLFQKMKEAGYEWDAEKKELRKIEQNPAWSEEDEKIKKAVLGLTYIDGIEPILTKCSVTKQDIRAWLEKQGEQGTKEETQSHYPQRFMVDDIIKYNGTEYKITSIESNGYRVYPLTYDEGAASLISFGASATLVEQKLAEWNEEDIMRIDNIIAIIEGKGYPDYVRWLESLKARVSPQPKQGWSKEDEEMLLSAIEYVCTFSAYRNSVVDWLKSLKNRVQPQPNSKWSGEDEEKRKNCIYWLEKARKYFEQDEDLIYENEWLIKCINWLKSLNYKTGSQKYWKPSESEIKILEDIFNGKINPCNYQATLQNFLEQLKILRDYE